MILWVPEACFRAMGSVGCRFEGCDGGEGASKLARLRDLLTVSDSSGCSAVLVDESAAGAVSSDRSGLPILDDASIVGGG